MSDTGCKRKGPPLSSAWSILQTWESERPHFEHYFRLTLNTFCPRTNYKIHDDLALLLGLSQHCSRNKSDFLQDWLNTPCSPVDFHHAYFSIRFSVACRSGSSEACCVGIPGSPQSTGGNNEDVLQSIPTVRFVPTKTNIRANTDWAWTWLIGQNSCPRLLPNGSNGCRWVHGVRHLLSFATPHKKYKSYRKNRPCGTCSVSRDRRTYGLRFD